MNKVLLHTPVGVRDIYGKECSLKLSLENKINDVFRKFGYQNIQTPTFEFFDIFSEERGSVASKNLYKFFDREGNTLVLRPDMTPSIARLVAKYSMNFDVPVKLCYNANTYINNSELQGKLKEITQLGCEQIGDDSIEADAEMIALVVDSLKAVGLKEFLVEIGEVDFYKGLLTELGLTEEIEEELRIRIENKNNFGVEELLDEQKVSEEDKQAFLKLPSLFGSIDVLGKAKKLTDNEIALSAIKRLEKLYAILEEYGVEKYISFDLGMVSNYNYYTGIIFKAYTYGSGNHIMTGGRYDKLLGQFGKDAPAIGFAIYMEQIMFAIGNDLMNENPEHDYEVLIYEPEFRKEALKLATEYRNQDKRVELLKRNPDISIEEYINYKKEDGAVIIKYYSKDGIVEL